MTSTKTVTMFRCPECGAEWHPMSPARKNPPHYRTCSKVRIPVAFLQDPRNPEDAEPGEWAADAE